MKQVEIERLYRYLIEYQKLDPAIARQILKKILKRLKEPEKARSAATKNRSRESVEKNDEML